METRKHEHKKVASSQTWERDKRRKWENNYMSNKAFKYDWESTNMRKRESDKAITHDKVHKWESDNKR